jgi:predicted nucleic acid-binding protein
MVLVDTSVWVLHFKVSLPELVGLLDDGKVMCHPFIVGEIACGNLRNRTAIITLLRMLPGSVLATHEEVMALIENEGLMGRGAGYVDMHLCASARLTGVPIWTLDRRLDEIAIKLGIDYIR